MQVPKGATVTTIQVPGATTTAGHSGVDSVLGSIQGGSNVVGGATGVYPASTMAQADNVPSSRLVPQVSGIISSILAPQATGNAKVGGTSTAQQPATSVSAFTPVTSSAGHGEAIGATSVAVPIASSSIAAPAVQTVVYGATLSRRADTVISSVIGEVINGNGATSTRANSIATTSLVPVVPTSTSRVTGDLGATTSLAPAVTSSALHGVTTSVLTGATSTSVPISAPTPSTLILLIPSAAGINGSLASNARYVHQIRESAGLITFH